MCIYRDHARYLYLQPTAESRQINRALVVPSREYRAELSTSSRTSLIFHSIDLIQNIPRRRLSRRARRGFWLRRARGQQFHTSDINEAIKTQRYSS